MVNDQEPRYRLVDANGNVVGSLFAESDGTLKLQEGTSGNNNELSLTTQGELEVEKLSTIDSQVLDFGTVPANDRGVIELTFEEDYSQPPVASLGLGATGFGPRAGFTATVEDISQDSCDARVYNDTNTDQTIDSCAFIVLAP